MSESPRRIGELIRAGGPTFSFEFFPPKDEEGVAQLWQAIGRLEAYRPTFVSVTDTSRGQSRERTVRVTARIARETSIVPMAHLTCVGHTVAGIEAVLDDFEATGVENVMLLRGDPADGPRAPWTTTPGGFAHASELVELVAARGGFDIGVAAFPEGHPGAASLDADADVLVAKARAGASFAVTQMFFRASDYFSLVERVRDRGVELPILPGIMPILNLAGIQRQGELMGSSVPAEIAGRLESRANDPVALRAEGIAVAAELCEELLAGGAPGLHFFTMNRSTATLEIFDRLNVRA